ncbi:YggT family protein [Corynebacterium sp. 320]|uniref:YggT family protein n=1 Tax=Corynebacterium zhongnanshanii TaxID=2768834 RepID=A0ABQ6VCZ5_9CORY|nr:MULTISPECIES: YggT family protein [Corynebacterium]KAB1502509.1 YggT family protein [Corynebacterium sp. 320]KAB1551270.1 YggT family protein [Corynebacterium sp. 321]KAB1551902.1 YggT family protein [Corynebacterium sp. 319]KAB3520810.1 YggT family protein [Corynebacterium zhongnanshanii]KAB3526116.1 YggT family protein [Corynebacterium sp. 250]
MTEFLLLLIYLIRLYIFLLLVRIVVEMIQSFSRNWRPPRWFSIVAEPIFKVTDPPVRALRRLIPPIQLGGVALDVSVLVLFFGLQILIMILTAMIGAF